MFAGVKVSGSLVNGDTFSRAYEMLVFIHKSKDIAQAILSKAVESFDPQRRMRSNKDLKFAGREENLFQDIVLKKSEQESARRQAESLDNARPQGANGLLSNSQMYIDYVQNIASEEFRSNSFYINLSVSCLLHHYSCQEAADIYNTLKAYDYEPVRVYDYHNKQLQTRKKKLKERFGAYENAVSDRNLCLRTMSVEDEDRFKRLLDKLLDFFTPWGTQCAFEITSASSTFNKKALAGRDVSRRRRQRKPIREIISDVLVSHSERDSRSLAECELDVHHALYHRECYRKIVSGLGLEKPEQKVHFPMELFAKQDSQQNDDFDDRVNSPPLNDEVMRLLKYTVVNRRQRTKGFQGTILKAVIDGEPKGYLNTDDSSPLTLEFEWGNRLVELLGTDEEGDFVFASLCIPSDVTLYSDGPLIARFRETGHRIEFVVRRIQGVDQSESRGLLEISYARSPIMGIARSFSMFFSAKPAPASKIIEIKVKVSSSRRTLGLIAATLFVIVAIILAYQQPWQRGDSQQAKENETELGGEDQKANKTARMPEQAPNENDSRSNLTAKGHELPNNRNGKDERASEETSQIPTKGTRLNEITTIYVDIDTKGVQLNVAEQKEVRLGLESVINRKYSIQDSAPRSDARLKIEIVLRDKRIKSVAHLLNSDGERLAGTTIVETNTRLGEPRLNRMNQLGREMGERLLQDIERQLSQKN